MRLPHTGAVAGGAWATTLIPVMSSLQVPVEMWCNILDESMLLPRFLDPGNIPELADPFYVSGSWMDQDYWISEKHRNNLRRVCKSWDAYLRPFEHRYVRINDIWHKFIPKDALRKAKRIGYRRCRNNTICDRCEATGGFSKHWHEFVPLLKSMGELSVQIIDMPDVMARFMPRVIREASSYLPHLEVILNCRGETQDWIGSLHSFPNLRFIRVDHYRTFPCPTWPMFQAPNLTLLSFSNINYPFSLPPYDCSLPSLQHLRFPDLHPFPNTLSSHIPNLIQVLEVHGRNLLSLQLGNPSIYHQVKIPGEVWSLCPRLERLDTSLGFSTDPTQLPPEDNNLKTLSFAMDNSHTCLEVATRSLRDPPFPPSLIARCPKLACLIAPLQWSEIADLVRRSASYDVSPWMRELVEGCQKYGVGFEDKNGDLFEDSELARLLEIIPLEKPNN